jgi:hypothetical protein
MSSSTAIARIPDNQASEAKTEKVPAIASISVPAALLLAAEAVSAKPGGPQTYLEGVYVHAKGDRGRVVGSDGSRLFIASFPLPTKEAGGAPAWMRDGGVILSNDGLRSRLALLGKLSDEMDVRVGYANGNASVELSDAKEATVFKIAAKVGTYPNVDSALGAKSFTTLDEDGNADVREWQPVGINSSYLKQCGDIAKTLEAGLEPDKRSKLGMVVRAFNGGASDSPLVFDFSTWPGAILVVAPAVMASQVTSKETAQLLAPAVKATVAALRAHATRWDQRAKEATIEAEKVEAQTKADGFRKRVANIFATVPVSGSVIGSDKPKPKPEAAAKPETETVAPADEEAKPEETVSRRPATKRTKIQVNQAAA